MIFMASGSGELYGLHTIKENISLTSKLSQKLKSNMISGPKFDKDDEPETFKIKCVTLPESSWFGDYQIMLSINSTWELTASQSSTVDTATKIF